MRICHVVNVVGASARRDLLNAQDLTLRSMEVARDVSESTIEVQTIGARFPDEQQPAAWLVDGIPLTRSVLDYGNFSPPRRLPLLADILGSLRAREFDVGIFTNIDIAIQPYFYDLIAELASQGHDAFSINRRTVHQRNRGSGLPHLASQTGSPHPGHDCFAFSQDVLRKTDVDLVSVGVPLVARAFLYNLMLHADSFRQFVDLHATFHVGDDRQWTGATFTDYTEHNHAALCRVMLRLTEAYGEKRVRQLPGADRFLNDARSSTPSPWRPRRPDVRKPYTERTQDRRRLVFAASPGRSGTEYLARLLGTAANACSSHEKEPTMAGEHLRSIAYCCPTDSYEHRMEKVESLRRDLGALEPNHSLVDTTHMFVKTFSDVVLDSFNHDLISVLELHRPLENLVASMLDLGWFSRQAPAWRDWLIPPTAPQSKFPIDRSAVLNRADLAIGYILDSAVRTRELRAATPNVVWLDVAVSDLRDEARVKRLFRSLELEPTNETWTVAGARINERNHLKEHRQVASTEAEINRHIESFATRFRPAIVATGVEDLFREYQ